MKGSSLPLASSCSSPKWNISALWTECAKAVKWNNNNNNNDIINNNKNNNGNNNNNNLHWKKLFYKIERQEERKW